MWIIEVDLSQEQIGHLKKREWTEVGFKKLLFLSSAFSKFPPVEIIVIYVL